MSTKDKEHISIRVYLEDTDRFGLLYHANYIKYFERGRTEWLRMQGLSLESIYQDGYLLVVSKIEVDYLMPAHLDDELFIKTKMIKNKMSLAIFKQEIINYYGQVICKAKIRLVGMDREKKLCNISKILSTVPG